jgi:peptidoglycan hydrolase-like protein with peptidoglycan-binding domain
MLCAAAALAILAGFAPSLKAETPPARKQAQSSPPAVRTPATAAQRRPGARRQAGNWRTRQQNIDRQRARQIQEALEREGYLEASAVDGIWGERSRQAMERYQADNGWQTKIVPDSRALIKLGLGPAYANVINPESIAPPEGSPAAGAAGAGHGSNP